MLKQGVNERPFSFCGVIGGRFTAAGGVTGRLSISAGGTGRVVLGREAEDVVHKEDEGAAFLLGELTPWVTESFDRSLCFGAGFAVFLELEGFAAGAGQGIHQTGESGGIASELFIQRAR